jgi:hypothetical protein
MTVKLNPTRMFGGLAQQEPANSDKADLPKAQTWLNVGYEVGEPGTDEYRFVSPPMGIPLDTMKPIEIRTRNAEFAAFQSSQNGCLKQLQDEAAKLAPGESVVIRNPESPLCIQLRRVNDPVEAPAADASNPYAVSLFS